MCTYTGTSIPRHLSVAGQGWRKASAQSARRGQKFLESLAISRGAERDGESKHCRDLQSTCGSRREPIDHGDRSHLRATVPRYVPRRSNRPRIGYPPKKTLPRPQRTTSAVARPEPPAMATHDEKSMPFIKNLASSGTLADGAAAPRSALPPAPAPPSLSAPPGAT